MDSGSLLSSNGIRRTTRRLAAALVTRLQRRLRPLAALSSPQPGRPRRPRPLPGAIIQPTQFIGVLPPDIFEEHAR